MLLPASDASALTLLVDKALTPEERARLISKLGPEAKRIAALLDRPDDTAPPELRAIADRLRALAARPPVARR